MLVYFPILFTFMACVFLGIGVKVLLAKRPLFIHSKYFFLLMILAFSPQFINTIDMLLKNHLHSDLTFLLYLSPIMYTCVLIFFWFQMKGYVAIGVSDDSFSDALHFSLNKFNLPFEEKLSLIKLPSIGADLQVAIKTWVGTGQIKLKEAKDPQLLTDIIEGMNEYCTENKTIPNNVTSIFYIIMGIFMLIFACVFFYISVRVNNYHITPPPAFFILH